MSLAVVYSRASLGIAAPQVTVEVHLSNGLPAFNMVGLPETSVKESRDRVRSALLNGLGEPLDDRGKLGGDVLQPIFASIKIDDANEGLLTHTKSAHFNWVLRGRARVVVLPTTLSKSYPAISPEPGRRAQISASVIRWPVGRSRSATTEARAKR